MALLLLVGCGGDQVAEVADGPMLDIEPLVAFVEAEVGRSFEHTPRVRVLDDQQFVAARNASINTEVNDDAIEIEVRFLQALGLTTMGIDEYRKRFVQQQGALVSATYDIANATILLRANLPPEVAEVALVHELTHALDDELSDLSAFRAARNERLRSGDVGAAFARSAVLEGRARAVENRFRRSKKYFDLPATSTPEVPPLPAAIAARINLAYTAGFEFIEHHGGPSATSHFIDNPPMISNVILHPQTLDVAMTQSWEPRHEDMTSGALATRSFGAIDLRVLLTTAGLAGYGDVLRATEGMGKGHITLSGDDTQSCVTIVAIGESSADATEIRDAIEGLAPATLRGVTVIDDNMVDARLCGPLVA